MDDSLVWAVLRRQRHSFLNHLQVISGWLQMNQPERARRYLETVAEDMSALAQATRLVPPEVGLAFLDLAMEAEVHGVRLVWEVSGAPAEIDPEALRSQLARGFGAVAGLPDDQRVITMAIGPSGFAIHTPSGLSEG